MPRENISQSNFTSGEVSPYVAGRVDTKVYANGLRTCNNFIVRPQGGASRRLGSRMVKPSWTADKTGLLVPFAFSDVQAYVLQFGSSTTSLAIASTASNGGPNLIRVTTTPFHNLTTGNTVRITGVTGLGAASTNGQWVVAVISTTTFDLVGSGWVATGTGAAIALQGFIQFTKDGEPLLETTTTEVESFTLTNATGLYQVGTTAINKLPGWGPISVFYGATSNNGTIVVSEGNGGLVRLTTSVPHTLRTGATVLVRAAPDPNTINNTSYVVNRINAYAVELVGTLFSGAGTDTAMFSHGLLAGDRFYISGAANYTDLTEQYHNVSAVVSHLAWTIANKTYANQGAVTGEEAWTIPIEVVTPYTSSEFSELTFAQTADIMYIMHPDHPTMKLTRLDDDGDRSDWLLSEVDVVDGPYLPANDNAPNVDMTTPANGSRYLDVYLEVSSYLHRATACSAPPSFSIVSTASSGGPNLIRVTTSAAHGFATNNYVHITGATGAGAASTNGYWKITAIAGTTFDLVGSAWVATVTGTVVRTFADTIDDASTGLFLEYRQGDQWRLAQVTTGGISASNMECATVDIIDNVLLYLDEATRFKNTPKNQSAPSGSGANSAWTPVYGTRRDGSSGIVRYQKLDANNHILSDQAAALTGTITSSFSNTFGVADVGKYIRYLNTAGTAYWSLITKVGATGASATHSAALTMVDSNTTGNFYLTTETRTATVKSYRNGSAFALFTLYKDVGRHIRLSWGGRWVWGKIATVVSTHEVTVNFYSDVPRDPHDARKLAGSLDGTAATASTTGRTYTWRLGAWSLTTGYPSAACFHEQRLVFGRTNTQPATFWGSVTGDFENMTPTELDGTVLDDNALDYTLASGRVNAIKWLESGTTLVLGTNGGEWVVTSSSAVQEPITPTNISVKQQSRHGSSRIAQPFRIGSSIIFVDRSEQKVQEVTYLFLEDRLEDKDLTVVSDHILRQGGTVVQTAFQQNPFSIGWFLLSDGTLAAVTYNSDQEIIAWHRHSLAGTGAFIESICVVPNEAGTEDDLYMLVKRTINGSTVRYVELMESTFYPSGSSRLGMQFVDCAKVVTGFTGTVITGLTYLTAESLTVLGNGTVITPSSFTAGVLTLAQAYAEVVVGLAYTSTLKSLPPEGGSAHGVSQGMKKRMPEMKVRVADSFGMNAGWATALVTQDFNATNFTQKSDSETTLPFYSGIVPLVPKTPYREDVPWTITYALPYPLNVLAVISVLETTQ